MNIPVAHHYLARFYLEGWTASDGKVSCFCWKGDKLICDRRKPKNTGFELHLYTIHSLPPAERAWLENFLARSIDEPASKALKILRAGGQLDNEGRANWTRFLMAQNARSPEMVSRIRRESVKHLNAALDDSPEEWEAVKDGHPECTLREYVEKHLPDLPEKVALTRVLPKMCLDENIGRKIFQMHWRVVDVSASSVDLVTSDHPFMITHGLDDRQCWLLFPISPTQVFVATHQSGLSVTDANRAVRDINRELARNARGRVWSTGQQHCRLVEKWLRKPLV